jgi:hypothetical protein
MQQLIQDMNQQLGTFFSFEHMEQVHTLYYTQYTTTLNTV